jgi:PKD repeat protein
MPYGRYLTILTFLLGLVLLALFTGIAQDLVESNEASIDGQTAPPCYEQQHVTEKTVADNSANTCFAPRYLTGVVSYNKRIQDTVLWGNRQLDPDYYNEEDSGEGDFNVNPTKSIYEVFYGEKLSIDVEVINEAEYTAEQDIKFWVGGRSSLDQETLIGSASGLELGEGETTTLNFQYEVPEEPQSNWLSEDKFHIRVTAPDGEGKRGVTDSTWRPVDVKEVKLPPPSADFSYTPGTPMIGSNISFDASDSFAREGTIESYQWKMGDGTEREGVSFEHSYDAYGEYNVSLNVSDGENEDTVNKMVVIENIPPEPVIELSTSVSNLTVEDEVVFDGSDSHDPDSDRIETYSWKFGDGTSEQGAVATHSYAEPGSYNMTLTVSDGIGVSSNSMQAKVINRPPEASFNYSPKDDLVTGERVVFNASKSYDPDTGIEEFRWGFGNNKTARGEVVGHTFEGIGTYEVLLTVDDGEKRDEEAVTVVVAPNEESADGFGILTAVMSLLATLLLISKFS